MAINSTKARLPRRAWGQQSFLGQSVPESLRELLGKKKMGSSEPLPQTLNPRVGPGNLCFISSLHLPLWFSCPLKLSNPHSRRGEEGRIWELELSSSPLSFLSLFWTLRKTHPVSWQCQPRKLQVWTLRVPHRPWREKIEEMPKCRKLTSLCTVKFLSMDASLCRFIHIWGTPCLNGSSCAEFHHNSQKD